MSTSALKERVTGQPAAQKTPVDKVAALLSSPSMQAQIKAALPRHMTPERLARIVTTEIRKVPKLAECTPVSFFGAVIQCAQLGLEPGNALGHAYILPYDKRAKVGGQWQTVATEAQLIIGYRGMIDLARRSGQIVSIDARAVYEGDKFECRLGLDSHIEHQPDWNNANRTQPDKLQFVYAVAKLKDGGIQFDVMSRAEVDAIRARSKAKDNGPWTTDYTAMALKTVVRRLFKFLPVSIEIQTAVGLDERAEMGLPQDNGAVIDGQFTAVEDEADAEDAPAGLTDQRQQQADMTLPGYDDLLSQIQKAKDVDALALVMDSARDLPEADRVKLEQAYEDRRETLLGA
ncbi:recombination protein RecT [Burkholderia gladioli]|uniref:recombination protein RecT n=1 Tax=Burkholderia gladioli TaxID=28095 RepID=UPI001640451C|nr:recombination protein RecT [Burkholderia gladioli]